jgi:hypothetical protein
MKAKRTVWAVMLLPLMLAGCLMMPGPGGVGVTLVPALPSIVVLGPEPYYVHQGYYYYYQNNGWYYSHSQRGPWVDLPRDHYPREVRYRDGGGERDGGRNSGHERR